jgi:hypothetical protein
VRRHLAIALAVTYLLITTAGALQHRLHPLFAESVWHVLARSFPSLAFGYVMFDTIPDRVPYYSFSVAEKHVSPSDVDHNAAWGYVNARFQINALLDSEYVHDVCAHSGRDFVATRILRDLSIGTEKTIGLAQCKNRMLITSLPVANAQ